MFPPQLTSIRHRQETISHTPASLQYAIGRGHGSIFVYSKLFLTRWWFILALVFLSPVIGQAQSFKGFSPEGEKNACSEKRQFSSHVSLRQPQSLASRWFDVTYYHLDLTITTSPPLLTGIADIEGTMQEEGSAYLMLDLADAMFIEYIMINDTLTSYQQFQTSFKIDLLHTAQMGETIRLSIRYSGVPVSTGFGSFIFGSHSDIPWVWSLSEPYGARDWFPCKDDPNDKADSTDVLVTVDSSFSVASNGTLATINENNDGTRTHRWRERYPIAPYLISIAITNYKKFSNWFRYSETDSMEVMNFVLPDHYAQAETSLVKTVGMLKIFSRLFGLYPFIKEKYGHADFGFGGAMEHQTITSTTTYQEGVLAHELAHQWFGDMITPKSWQHLWLNEGFAQYSEALYMEQQYSDSVYRMYIGADLYKARSAIGTLFVRDTSTVRRLFDPKLVYSKGSVVLHMLRHVLGDSVFFRCMYNYANSPSLKYSNASTEDFQAVCEATSGKQLTYFFKQWIYGENFPKYTYWWKITDSTSGYSIQLGVKQQTGTVNPSSFIMPVDFEIKGDNFDTTITLMNSQQIQFYTIALPQRPDSVKLDPKNWILKDAMEISPDGQPFPAPFNFSLDLNFPNPFNSSTTIPYSVKQGGIVTIKVYSLLGIEVATILNELQLPGDYRATWQALNLPTGLYFCRISSGGNELVKPMILLK